MEANPMVNISYFILIGNSWVEQENAKTYGKLLEKLISEKRVFLMKLILNLFSRKIKIL
jgi:hypothetical protein